MTRKPPEIVLATKEDSEFVLSGLIEIGNKFAFVTLADLCELVGIPSKYVDNKWGWLSLINVQIIKKDYGYVIDLPEMEAILI